MELRNFLKRPKHKKWILAVSGPVVAMLFFFMLGTDSKSFRIPTVGTYTGFITWDDAPLDKTPLVIHRLARTPELLVIVGGRYGSMKRFALDLDGSRWLPPLQLGDEQLILTTTNDEPTPNSLDGYVQSALNRRTGAWRLNATEMPNGPATFQAIRWATTFGKLEAVKRANEFLQKDLKEKESEIEKLTKFIVDQSDFRDAAKNRLGETSDSLVTAQKTLQSLRAEVVPLERQLEVASRVTARGKLVELSRESLARESEWILATLHKVSPETSREFDKALEKARRVMDLRQQIAAEATALENLKNREYQLSRESRFDVPSSDIPVGDM